MGVKNVRLHLRILRRCSLAVKDQSAPKHEYSALYYFERNEEIWGRRAAETALQESTRYFDSFQSALPDLSDLRNAAECSHVTMLRGYNVKVAGRQVSEHAKALAMYNKVPAALFPRFPRYASILHCFETLLSFHKAFPAGLHLNGTAVALGKVEMPIYGQECVERLVQEVLLPLMAGKKHTSLFSGGAALSLPFLKAILPELEQLYFCEDAAAAVPTEKHGSSTDLDDNNSGDGPVTEQEAKALEQACCETQSKLLDKMAKDYLNKSVVFLQLDEANILDKILAQPMMQDGAAKLLVWNAGTQATKDPPKYISPYRKKASADEANMKLCMNMAANLLGDADTAIFISGRNNLIYKDMRKEACSMKPRLGIKELLMEPDEEQVIAHIRLESNKAGSIDMKDGYIQMVKNAKLRKNQKGVPRRFVPRNTAFKSMSHLPVLTKDAMTWVSQDERERVFRGVVASDKWTPGKKSKGVSASATPAEDPVADSDDDDREEEADDQAAVEQASTPDSGGNVVFFWMELHPKAARQA